MLAYLLSTCICESLALVYSLSMRRNEMDYKVGASGELLVHP